MLLAGWQTRPHDALRDPLQPRRMLSPNEKYTALVAAAGYLPLTLSGEGYLELLPVEWRQINAYGIRIGYRTYDCVELGAYRLQHSGVTARRGLWEVHYDPYDATKVFLRTPDGWVTVPWTHLPMGLRRSPSSPGATPASSPPSAGWTTRTRPRSRRSLTTC